MFSYLNELKPFSCPNVLIVSENFGEVYELKHTYKRKRKILWLNEWHISEQEALFADMAAKGWQLIDIGNIFAIFEQYTPESTNFKCDIFDVNDSSDSADRLKTYQEAGWEYVTSRNYIQVFKESSGAAGTEIPVDPARHEKIADIFQRSIKKKVSAVLLATVILVILQFLTLQNDPVDNYLKDRYLFFFVIVIIYLFSIIRELTNMVQMKKLIKKLRLERQYINGVDYKLKIHQKRLSRFVMILFLTVGIIYIFPKDLKKQFPSNDLQVAQLADVLDDAEYEQINVIEAVNHYTEDSSLLVPQQYEIMQSVDVVSQTNDQIYNPSIWSYRYEARNEWLAKKFLQTLKQEQSDNVKSYEQISDDRFDELWIKRDQENVELLIRNAKEIHGFSFYSTERIAGVTEKALVRIDELYNQQLN